MRDLCDLSFISLFDMQLSLLQNEQITTRLLPEHNKVMRRRPDRQGRSGLQGFRKAAPALTLKMISVFLMLAVLDYSLISVTQAEGLPRSLSKQNQLRTLINMSPMWYMWYTIRYVVSYKIIQDERSVSI